ncbi:hypothetical protein DKX38_012364 [Salix brachista]|uniref:Uncharacterized protein n=1 Tax=Salix brachista TaxID=2182728 RepID=A0A5N5LNQ6_9ROSI|nr:hypothetical protein DKX38_012364 [Salix brachista]
MRKFDPWGVFFKREWNRNWPFLTGFAITGALITKFSLSLTGKPLASPLYRDFRSGIRRMRRILLSCKGIKSKCACETLDYDGGSISSLPFVKVNLEMCSPGAGSMLIMKGV